GSISPPLVASAGRRRSAARSPAPGHCPTHRDSPSCVRAPPPARFRGLRPFCKLCSPTFPPLPVHLYPLKEKAAHP
ncbi:hypothetical protein BRADI_4g21086v3, partial [Brachypodium distachyon]